MDSPVKTILVASAAHNDGRSTVAANLAIFFARAGEQVILVDADLREPALESLFGARSSFGLADLLRRDTDVDEALINTDVANLRLVPAGFPPSDPSELLASASMGRALGSLRAQADIVIIDSPPMFAATDAAVLASRVDATLIVVAAGRTSERVLLGSVHELRSARASILGIVVNHVRARRRRYGALRRPSNAMDAGAPAQPGEKRRVDGALTSRTARPD
jgi:capsular exopolysaccharide synthesis family protein